MVSSVTAPVSDPTTTRGLLRSHRDLRLLLAAGLVTMTGDWMLSVGLVYTVYDVTGSTLASAGALMAAFVPQVVTGLFAGVFVDRWSRARTMVVGNLLMAVGLAPLLLVHDRGDVWIVYAVLAANAVLDVFVATADSAMLPLIVPGEGRLTANALNGQVGQVARLVGGAAGGVVAATGGLGAVVVVDAASFLLAALLVQLIRTPTKPPREVDDDAAPGAAAAVRRAAVEWIQGATTVRALTRAQGAPRLQPDHRGRRGDHGHPVHAVREGRPRGQRRDPRHRLLRAGGRRDPRRLRRGGRRTSLVVARRCSAGVRSCSD